MIYNAVGFAAGCLIAIVFFGGCRSWSSLPGHRSPPSCWPRCARLTGFRLNLFLNIMTPLIMVISFSDSMQLTFAARDRLIAGENRYDAFRHALLVVGPACVLTHGTAGLSFLALQFSQSDLIRSFGEAGLIATMIALVTVLTLVPLLGIALVRHEAQFAADASRTDRAVEFLRNACGWIAGRMVRHPGAYSLAGLVIVAMFAAAYAQSAAALPSRRSGAGSRPGGRGGSRLDSELTGSSPINVMIQFPPELALLAGDPAGDRRGSRRHAAPARDRKCLVVETLRRWLAQKAGRPDVATLKQYVDILPEYLVRRFISADQHAVVIAGRVPDVDASKIRPIVAALDRALASVRTQHPGYTISVTSLSAIAARNSAAMIEKLNWASTVEVVFVAAFIGLAFRSLLVMCASILPAIFPIVVSGSLLWALGDGLQFASVIALTVRSGWA